MPSEDMQKRELELKEKALRNRVLQSRKVSGDEDAS
jgi:hypothetical protein